MAVEKHKGKHPHKETAKPGHSKKAELSDKDLDKITGGGSGGDRPEES